MNKAKIIFTDPIQENEIKGKREVREKLKSMKEKRKNGKSLTNADIDDKLNIIIELLRDHLKN